jgi:hypothetical protein
MLRPSSPNLTWLVQSGDLDMTRFDVGSSACYWWSEIRLYDRTVKLQKIYPRKSYLQVQYRADVVASFESHIPSLAVTK